jgi:hypothetical protein
MASRYASCSPMVPGLHHLTTVPRGHRTPSPERKARRPELPADDHRPRSAHPASVDALEGCPVLSLLTGTREVSRSARAARHGVETVPGSTPFGGPCTIASSLSLIRQHLTSSSRSSCRSLTYPALSQLPSAASRAGGPKPTCALAHVGTSSRTHPLVRTVARTFSSSSQHRLAAMQSCERPTRAGRSNAFVVSFSQCATARASLPEKVPRAPPKGGAHELSVP